MKFEFHYEIFFIPLTYVLPLYSFSVPGMVFAVYVVVKDHLQSR